MIPISHQYPKLLLRFGKCKTAQTGLNKCEFAQYIVKLGPKGYNSIYFALKTP